METLVIQPKNKEELKLLEALAKKMGIKTKVLSNEKGEELGLAEMMREADRNQKVTRGTIMKKLNQNEG